MAQYNIVRNSLFTSNTSDGIGTRGLNNLELASLINGNEADVAVVLNSSEVLCLDVDLVTRIKVSSILLYASDLTKLGNVDFYYKNDSVEDFTLCSKEVNAYAYSAQIPYPSAPSAIRCTVSGIDIDLYEFFIFNEDISVGFGYDGSESYKWLEDTPIGAESPVYEVEIFNNNTASDKSINAYVCVDYDGYNESQYLSIASSEEGPYSFVRDGVLFGLNGYSWAMGTRSNLTIDSTTNSLKLIDKGYIVTTYKNFLGIVPNTVCYYLGIPFGLKHCWDYAADKNKIYAFFYEGSDYYQGLLRLYSYDLSNNIWDYLCNIAVAGSSIRAHTVALAYKDNYIYFTYRENSFSLFRHNLSGAFGNYEQYINFYPSYGNGQYSTKLCSAGNYIALAGFFRDGNYIFECIVFNIEAKTYLSAGRPYFSSSITVEDPPISLVYDDVAYLYIYLSRNSEPMLDWVARYHIPSNTWIKQFFNFRSRIGVPDSRVDMSYYNNRLFFISRSLGSKCYVYNILTDQVTSFDLGCTFFNKNNVICLAVPPQNTLDDFSLYYVGVTSSNFSEYGFYGHNTNFGTLETENILNPQVGTFTSTIFYLEDVYKASYLLTDTSSTPGSTSISKVGDAVENVIEVRSSNIAPVVIDIIYWAVMTGDTYIYITKYNINTNNFLENYIRHTKSSHRIYNLAVCRRTGNLCFMFSFRGSSTYHSRLAFYDYYGNHLSTFQPSGFSSLNSAYLFWAGDLSLWAAFTSDNIIYHVLKDYDNYTRLTDVSVYCICAELSGGGAWYTDRSFQRLVALSAAASTRLTISLGSVYGVCGTEDNGCWVIDNADIEYGNTIKRFSYEGDLVSLIKTSTPFIYLVHDHSDGFYALSSSLVGVLCHYTSDGIEDLNMHNLGDYNSLRGGRHGVVLHSTSTDKIAYISLKEKAVIWEKNRASFLPADPTYASQSFNPDIFSWDLAAELQFKTSYTSSLFPVPYDDHWNSLEWQSIPKDGYFLPHNKYHQVRVTLRNLDAATTPELKSLVIAPVVKIEEIPVQKSKPVFVKTDLPVTNDGKQFNVKLRVWWGLEE